MEESNTQSVVITDIQMPMQSIVTLIFQFAIAQFIVVALVGCAVGIGFLVVYFM
jgi:hypothetical protein